MLWKNDLPDLEKEIYSRFNKEEDEAKIKSLIRQNQNGVLLNNSDYYEVGLYYLKRKEFNPAIAYFLKVNDFKITEIHLTPITFYVEILFLGVLRCRGMKNMLFMFGLML